MKTGGLRGALHFIDLAREHGIQCQIGSMIESMYGIAMGCNAFILRPEIISTDLYAFHRLKTQYAKGISIEKHGILIGSKLPLGAEIKSDEDIAAFRI